MLMVGQVIGRRRREVLRGRSGAAAESNRIRPTHQTLIGLRASESSPPGLPRFKELAPNHAVMPKAAGNANRRTMNQAWIKVCWGNAMYQASTPTAAAVSTTISVPIL